ncbi:hypothetical protein cand_025840 [Cryptosporidium andersoni]|uniref:Uncharacterized protein n=1 Tax=Cryptosporidium andersoni TaxID=117008 RepID=A0A1J4MAB4_9CRYT|nr:hypothetical protein cand_025840 [Cryptosporidium andersoni]
MNIIKRIWKVLRTPGPTLYDILPLIILAVYTDPLAIFCQSKKDIKKKKLPRISIFIYNLSLWILVLLVFILILFVGGIAIGQITIPPIYIGELHGMPLIAQFFTISPNGTFLASMKVFINNKSSFNGRLIIQNINISPVLQNFFCTPASANNNFMLSLPYVKSHPNFGGFVFPLNLHYKPIDDTTIKVSSILLKYQNVNFQRVKIELGKYGAAEELQGIWLPSGVTQYSVLLKGSTNLLNNSSFKDEIGSRGCLQSNILNLITHISLDYSVRYFLGSKTVIKQDIGYIAFPACYL